MVCKLPSHTSLPLLAVSGFCPWLVSPKETLRWKIVCASDFLGKPIQNLEKSDLAVGEKPREGVISRMASAWSLGELWSLSYISESPWLCRQGSWVPIFLYWQIIGKGHSRRIEISSFSTTMDKVDSTSPGAVPAIGNEGASKPWETDLRGSGWGLDIIHYSFQKNLYMCKFCCSKMVWCHWSTVSFECSFVFFCLGFVYLLALKVCNSSTQSCRPHGFGDWILNYPIRVGNSS